MSNMQQMKENILTYQEEKPLTQIEEEKQPSSCIGCQSCEAVCPQQLKISEAMADFCER